MSMRLLDSRLDISISVFVHLVVQRGKKNMSKRNSKRSAKRNSKRSAKRNSTGSKRSTQKALNVLKPEPESACNKIGKCIDFTFSNETGEIDIPTYLDEDPGNIVFILMTNTCKAVCYHMDYLKNALNSKKWFTPCVVSFRRGNEIATPDQTAPKYANLQLGIEIDSMMVLGETLKSALRRSRRIGLMPSTWVDRFTSQDVIDGRAGSAVSGLHCQSGQGRNTYTAYAM